MVKNHKNTISVSHDDIVLASMLDNYLDAIKNIISVTYMQYVIKVCFIVKYDTSNIGGIKGPSS